MSRDRAFSLIEILVVIAIIGLLAMVAIPALNQVTSSMSLVQAGQMVNDQLVQARQQATALNTGTELRFIVEENVDNNGSAYTAIQLWQLDHQGRVLTPLGRTEQLPVAVLINPQLSGLLSQLPTETAEFPSLGQRSYVALRYRANGRLEANTTLKQACITVQLRRANRTTPTNYYTLQINPLTGRIATYRP